MASGTAARISDTARAPPSRSTPSAVSRPLGHSTTLSPRLSASATLAAAWLARLCASALAFSMSGTLMVPASHAIQPVTGFWKFTSFATGRK